MADYTVLYNSSRGSVFFVFLFMFIAFVWAILRLVKGKYVLMADRYAPNPNSNDPTNNNGGTGDNFNNNSSIKPPVPITAEPAELSGIEKFITMYEDFITQLFWMMVIAVLNVVMFRCWAYCLVNWFIVMIPMFIFNVMKHQVSENLVVCLLTKYFAHLWIIGFFINIWTITSYA